MNPAFVMFLVGTFLIGVLLFGLILAWRKFRAIDRRLGQMQQEIHELRWLESRIFMMGINAKLKADPSETESQKDVVGQDAKVGMASLVPIAVPSAKGKQ
jgi:hypothetical protein